MKKQKEKELPKNYVFRPLPDGLYIGFSEIEGNGLFTKSYIPMGVTLGPSHIKLSSTTFESNEYINSIHDNGLLRLGLGSFINHTPAGNINMVDKGEYYVFVTNRVIYGGEELTINYHKTKCGVK